MWSVTTANLPNELVVVAVSNVNSAAVNAMPADQLQQLKQLYRQSRGQQILKTIVNI